MMRNAHSPLLRIKNIKQTKAVSSSRTHLVFSSHRLLKPLKERISSSTFPTFLLLFSSNQKSFEFSFY